jgi:integrase/recombinase XerD
MTKLVDKCVQSMVKKPTKTQIEVVKQYDKKQSFAGIRETTRRERIQKFFQFLLTVNKEFKDVTEKDIEDFLQKIKDMELRDSYFEYLKSLIKQFFKGTKLEKSELLKRGKVEHHSKTSKDMLTEDEVMQMIASVNHPQEKAVLALLWETGCRVGELCNCNIEDCVEIGNRCKIILRGKTGTRERELIISRKYIQKWIEVHPFKNQPKQPLFLSFSHRRYRERITTACVEGLCNNAKRLTGITKRVTPHIFRHSRATYLAQHLKEAEMRQYFGWSRDSGMPSVYIHLSQSDVDTKYEAIITGQKKELEHKPSVLAPKNCPWCDTKNEPTVRYCSKCGGRLLDEKGITITDEMRIIEIFRTGFGKELLRDYDNLKIQASLLEQFYNCFNGSNVLEIDTIRQRFKNFTDDQLIELLGILRGYQLIDIIKDKIFLLDRKKFEQEIQEHKKLIKVNL